MSNIIDHNRDYIVVKSNKLVLQTRYNYTVQQQKMIAYICSRLNPNCKNLDFKMPILEYLRIMNIPKSGFAYEEVKSNLQELANKSMWLTTEDGKKMTLVRWLSKVKIDPETKEIYYRLDEDLVPYLFELKDFFFSYTLREIINFKSKYSIRIYELLKSEFDKKTHRFNDRKYIFIKYSIEEFKDFLMIEQEQYKEFRDFKRRVLLPAKNEINKLSNAIFFDFETIKEGKKVVGIKLIVRNKLLDEKISTIIDNNNLYKT